MDRGNTRRFSLSAFFKADYLRPLLVLVFFCLVYVLVFFHMNAARYEQYACIHDISLFEQTLYQTSKGNIFANSAYENQCKYHFSPILFAVVPVYMAAPRAVTLLDVIVAAMALSAVILFFFALQVWKDPWAAAMLGIAFLLHPVSHGLSISGFQPMKLAIPLFLIFFWKVYTGKPKTAWIFMLLLFFVREDIVAIVFCTGLYFAIFHKRIKDGLSIAGLSVLYFGLVKLFYVFVLGYAPMAEPFLRYHHLGSSSTEIIGTIIAHPINTFLGMFDTSEKVAYLPAFVLPLLGAPLIGIKVLLIGAPLVAANLLSKYLGQQIPILHYSALLLALVFAAVVIGMDRKFFTGSVRRLRIIIGLMILGCIGSIFVMQGYYGFSSASPKAHAWAPFDSRDLARLQMIERDLKPSASLAASRSVVSHFAKRDKLMHLLYDVKPLEKGEYEFVLMDMQAPLLLPSDQRSRLIEVLNTHFRPILGKPGERIFLFHKRPNGFE